MRRTLDRLEQPATAPPTGISARSALEADTELGPLLVRADDVIMTPFIRERGIWEPAETAYQATQPGAGALRSTLVRTSVT
jgi:hypothetical protein